MSRFRIDTSIAAILQHLGIESAHFAARLDSDWTELVVHHPEVIRSLTLICPPSIDAAAMRALASKLLVINGDRPSGRRVAEAMIQLPDAEMMTLDDFDAFHWTDVAADRPERVGSAILNFLARMEATSRNGNAVTVAEGGGEIDGVAYSISGSGPPLVLLPLSLAPSQWAPILPMLSERVCTINLTGANVGFVSVLEARGRSGYLGVVRSVLDEVSLHPGDNILEVGCGSGVLSRWLAHRTRCANPIVALDLNDYLLREAQALAAKEGLSEAIAFRNGDAERLPFPDDSFSVTLAFTVLEEGNANRMLAEMVRVTKPGGHIAVIVRSVDMGWTVNLDLPPTLKAKVEAPTGSVASEGCADRSLYARMRQAGLTERKALPQLAALSGPMGYYYLDRLQGSLSDEEACVWRSAMTKAEVEGTLFIAQPFHCAVGLKPE